MSREYASDLSEQPSAEWFSIATALTELSHEEAVRTGPISPCRQLIWREAYRLIGGVLA